MLTKETMIKVTNRDNGIVSYLIKNHDNRYDIHRTFQSGQTIEIPYGELEALFYEPGGEYMIKNLFRIDNQEAIENLIGAVEPEYHYSEADIRKLLKDGTLDELKDCLDFAPEGVIELVKQIAVETKLDSKAKCEAIKEKTDFDVSIAIEFNQLAEDAEKAEKASPSGFQKLNERRVQPETEKRTERRTAAPKYEVIKK